MKINELPSPIPSEEIDYLDDDAGLDISLPPNPSKFTHLTSKKLAVVSPSTGEETAVYFNS